MYISNHVHEKQKKKPKELIIFHDEDEFKDYVDKNPENSIILYNNEVFDVTAFLDEHPGGSDIIEDCNGCDISEIFHSDYPHPHSDRALKILMKYKIGKLIMDEEEEDEDNDDQEDIGNKKNNQQAQRQNQNFGKGNEQNQAKYDNISPKSLQNDLKHRSTTNTTTNTTSRNRYPLITDSTIEYKDGFQLDRTQGLLKQISKIKKKDYLEALSNPIMIINPMNYFESRLMNQYVNAIWGIMSKIKVVMWVIVVVALICQGIWSESRRGNEVKQGIVSSLNSYLQVGSQDFSGIIVVCCFVFGVIIWTKLEYLLHRYLLHPESPCLTSGWRLSLHFYLIGGHYMFPHDPRAMSLPLLFIIILHIMIFKIIKAILGDDSITYIIMSGIIFGYGLYDILHGLIHDESFDMRIGYLQKLRIRHEKHHYVNRNGGSRC